MDGDTFKQKMLNMFIGNDGVPTISAEKIDMFLEMARSEYGKYRPSPRIANTVVKSYRPYIETSEEIVSVLAVYSSNRLDDFGYPFDVLPSIYGTNVDPTFTYSMNMDSGYSSPSLQYIASYYREKASNECDFMVYGNRIIPTLTTVPARVVAVYGVVPTWEEVPEKDFRLFYNFVLGTSMQQGMSANVGAIKVPTPVGFFEFDGGKSSQTASKSLLDDFYNELGQIPTYITSG